MLFTLKLIVTALNTLTLNTLNIKNTDLNFYLNVPFNISYENIFTLANMSQLAYEIDNHLPIENSTIKAFLFSNENNTFNIVSIKGTTPRFIPIANLVFQTSNLDNLPKNDKLNDNLFFSCCFYKQSNLFYDHCSYKVPSGKNECSIDCYKNSTLIENNYYTMSLKIIENLMKTIDFYNSTVIFTGHSLGGAIATFLGTKFNKTTVTFETPGELHFLNTLGNVGNNKQIYHFGHTADPIVTGECGNSCWVMGYNIDTKCHTGYSCIYDSKLKLNLSPFLWRHSLKWVINWIIPYWKDDFPECIYNKECTDCENWSYI